MKSIKPTSSHPARKFYHAQEIIALGHDNYVYNLYLDRAYTQRKNLKCYREYRKHTNRDVLLAPLEGQKFWFTRRLRDYRVIRGCAKMYVNHVGSREEARIKNSLHMIAIGAPKHFYSTLLEMM